MVPRLFRPWADMLLDRLELTAGEVVLDVACGTGSVTRRAASRVGPYGRVTGCDSSPAMLAVARSEPSATVDYVECPADALVVASAGYDVVTCQQGLQFFSSRDRALREMSRALRPGGRLGAALWCAIDESPPFAALAAAVAKVVGEKAAAAYRDGPWGLAECDVPAMVARAGFSDVRASRHELPVTFEGGPRQLVRTLAASGIAPHVAALGEAGQDALLAAVDEAAAPIIVDGVIRSQTAARLITATVGR